MNTQTHDLTLLGNLRGLARRNSLWTLMTRTRNAAATGLREVWAIMNAATSMRNELRRMADQCEATEPEQAARLRQWARSTWE